MVKEIIKDFLKKLEDYKNTKQYGCDLAYAIFEQYNADCSVTYNTYEAREWLFKNSDELAPIIEELEEDGYKLPNPLFESEELMVVIYLKVAETYLDNCILIQKNYDKEIYINDEFIKELTEELENLLENY